MHDDERKAILSKFDPTTTLVTCEGWLEALRTLFRERNVNHADQSPGWQLCAALLAGDDTVEEVRRSLSLFDVQVACVVLASPACTCRTLRLDLGTP